MILHTFCLIERNLPLENVSYAMCTKGQSVSMHDYLVWYIFDSLNWLPSDGPNSHGINYHGRTLFDFSVLGNFSAVLQRWMELFALAPDEFVAQRISDAQEDTTPESEYYSYYLFKKYEVLAQLGSLNSFILNGINLNMSLLHWGV